MSQYYFGPIAYAAYCLAVDNKTWDGRPCPTWEALTDKIRDAWEAAGDAAAQQQNADLARVAGGLGGASATEPSG